MKKLVELVGNGMQYILTVAQTNEIFQLIELILSISTTLFILLINIIAWWKKAKKDGKIDEEEINELKQIVNDGKEKIETIKKKGE